MPDALLPAVPAVLALELAPVPTPPEGRAPAAAYLAHLTTGAGRRTMRGALELAAQALSGGRSTAATLPWPLLRAEHVDALRAFLLGATSAKTGAAYAPGTVNKVLAAVRGVAERCWMMGTMDGEVLARIRKVNGVKHTSLQAGRALTPEELQRFLTHDGSPIGARDVAAAVLFYAAGVRRSELATMRCEHYDPATGRLYVKGKGHKDRTTYLLETARPALAAWLELRGAAAGPMLCRVTGAGKVTPERRMSAEAIYQRVQRRIAEAGLAHCSPHDFRRTFISDMLDAGVDLVTIAKMVGHASTDTTARYDRRGERAKQHAATMLRLPGEVDDTVPCPHCGGTGRVKRI